MDVTKSSVALAWVKPKYDGGSAITGYFIEHKLVSVETWTRHTVAVSSTMFTLSGLTPDAEYSFRIVAANAIGQSEAGPASEPVTCKDPFGENQNQRHNNSQNQSQTLRIEEYTHIFETAPSPMF